MKTFDTLRGGSVARLRKYRADLARSLETIKAHRTPEEAARFIETQGYTSPLKHRYNWLGGDHAPTFSDNGDYANAPTSYVDAWRDVGDSDSIINLRHRGWYADVDGDTIYRGHVWQLPARAGVAQYVAGYSETDSGYSVLCANGRSLELFDEKEDAARAGDALAERVANVEREHNERWLEASTASAERDDARETLKDAHAAAVRLVAALRELPPVVIGDGEHVDAFSVARAQLCESLAHARNDMHNAINEIETQTAKIADLDMTGEF